VFCEAKLRKNEARLFKLKKGDFKIKLMEVRRSGGIQRLVVRMGGGGRKNGAGRKKEKRGLSQRGRKNNDIGVKIEEP